MAIGELRKPSSILSVFTTVSEFRVIKKPRRAFEIFTFYLEIDCKNVGKQSAFSYLQGYSTLKDLNAEAELFAEPSSTAVIEVSESDGIRIGLTVCVSSVFPLSEKPPKQIEQN